MFEIELELTNRCNLACPYCLRTLMPNREKKELTLGEIKKIFTKRNIEDVATIIYCGELGEPTLNNELIDIINFFYDLKPDIGQLLHTNGCTRNVKFWKELSKFTELVVQWNVDGLKDTIQLYRKGSSWDKIMENLDTFLENHDKSFWRYIIFDWNQHQIQDAKQLSREKDIPLLLKRNAEFVDSFIERQEAIFHQFKQDKTQNYQYSYCNRGYIDRNGIILPCCYYNIAYLKEDQSFPEFLDFYKNNSDRLNAINRDFREILDDSFFKNYLDICHKVCNPIFKEWSEEYRYPLKRTPKVNELNQSAGGGLTGLKWI